MLIYDSSFFAFFVLLFDSFQLVQELGRPLLFLLELSIKVFFPPHFYYNNLKMNKIKAIENLTKYDLENQVDYKASWHYQYNKSAYIYVGGLNYLMNEGDLALVFS